MIIRTYGGQGASTIGTSILTKAFQRHLSADVAIITQDEMKGSVAWRRETSLLVFSGKSVGEFKEALGPEVLQEIRKDVYEGAYDYAGICAGAALGSAQAKYRLQPALLSMKGGVQKTGLKRPSQQQEDGPYIKTGTGLSFFNGLATGPVKSITQRPFSGESQDLTLVTLRTSYGTSYNSAYWGGPALIPLEKVQLTASAFLANDGLPMSLSMKYGEGNVTLTSHHPEIDRTNIWHWAEKRQLAAAEIDRLDILARKLDGMAFQHFLYDAGLVAGRPIKREVGLEASFA